MEVAIKFWTIILWFGPIIGTTLFFIANYKINLKEKSNKEINTITIWNYIIWIAPILGAILYFFINFKISNLEDEVQKINERKSALEGKIFNKSTSSNKSKDLITVIVGSNKMMFKYDKKELNTRKYYFKPFQQSFYDSTSLIIELSNKGLFITATFRSLDGKIIAEINKNEWEVNSNNYLKRNYDKYGLEVIDNYGVPVLQIDMIDKSTIYFGGAYRTDRGLYIIQNRKIVFNSADVMPSLDKYIELGNKIKKMFKYPSNKNFGLRENNNR